MGGRARRAGARPGSTWSSSARGPRSSPAKRAGATCGRARTASDRAGRASATRCAPRTCTTASATTCTKADGRTPRSPRSSAWSSSCRDEPPSAERARALAALAHGLMLAWRFDESLAICEQALALAREVGAREAELASAAGPRQGPRLRRPRRRGSRASPASARARRGERRSAAVLTCVRLAHRRADDAGTATRVGTSRRTGARGRPPYGIDSTRAPRELHRGPARDRRVGRGGQASARPRSAPSPPTSPTCSSCSAPTSSSGAATSMPRGRISTPRSSRCARTAGRASTTSTSRSWRCGSGAGQRPTRQCATASRERSSPQAAQLHVWFCAKGLRAQAELAALARARRDADAVRSWLARARKLIGVARRAARRPQRSRPMPPAGSRSPKPSTTAPAAMRVPSLGRRRQTRGSGSSVCLWPPTAAGVRRRRSSPSARSRTEASVPLSEALCRLGSDRSAAAPAGARTARATRTARPRTARRERGRGDRKA